MNRSTATTYFGIAASLLMTVGHACPSPHQESTLNQNVPSLEVKQGDVRDVIRKLFKEVNAAYTIGPDVQGGVSVSLRNVTFETALQNVLKQVDSTYRIEGGLIHIIRRIRDWDVPECQPSNLPAPPTSIPATPKGATSVVQDGQFLYIIRESMMFKVRKSDLKVVVKGKLPG